MEDPRLSIIFICKFKFWYLSFVLASIWDSGGTTLLQNATPVGDIGQCSIFTLFNTSITIESFAMHQHITPDRVAELVKHPPPTLGDLGIRRSPV